MNDLDPERLEQIIAAMRAGLDVIARTEPFGQTVAKGMRYEAKATLRLADEIRHERP